MTLAAGPRRAVVVIVLAALVLSSTSAPVQAREGSVPAQPTGLATEAFHDSVTLSWDDPDDATITHYQVLRRDRDVHAVGEFVTIESDTGSAATTYTDVAVESERHYLYRVKAVNPDGVSHWSSYASVDTPAASPPEPEPDPTDPTPDPPGTPDPTPDPPDPTLGEGSGEDRSDRPDVTPVSARGAGDATGAPTISGTAKVGETLTASTTGIADPDGLTNASFSHQWIRRESDGTETDIDGATASTYPPVGADVGRTIKVRVSFTDNANFDESLTSAASAAVEVPGAVIWSAMLSVKRWDSSSRLHFGFEKDTTGSGTLVPETFDHDGRTYTVDRLFYSKLPGPDDDKDLTFRIMPVLAAGTYGLYLDGNKDGYVDADPFQIDADGMEQVFEFLDVSLSWTKKGGDFPTVPVRLTVNQVPTGAPAISGTAKVGETLTADTTGIADADGLPAADQFSYRWFRTESDGTETRIRGVTTSTYTLVAADLGRTIKVRVRFTDNANFDESLTSAATVPVATASNEPATGTPAIGGTARVGETLTASTTGIADVDGLPAGDHFSYQWIRNDGTTDTGISGATASTYTLVAADLGMTIKVRVSFTDGGGSIEALTSDPTATVEVPGQIIWSATLTVGEWNEGSNDYFGFKSANPETGALDPETFNYGGTAHSVTQLNQRSRQIGAILLKALQFETAIALAAGDYALYLDWKADGYVDGVPFLIEASGKMDALRFLFLDVDLSWARQGDFPTVPVRLTANRASTGKPAISGTAEAGQTLTAGISGIADADGLPAADQFSYQWIRTESAGTETDIDGATASTYRLVAADAGRTIKVRVSFTDKANFDESSTSAATAAVTAVANQPATGAPAIGGTAHVGARLTADISGIADPNGLPAADQFSYQWIRNDGNTGTDIADATSSTYRPVVDDVDKTLTVRVSFYDNNAHLEQLTSEASAVVVASPYGEIVWSALLTVGQRTFTGGTLSGFDDTRNTPIGSLHPETFTFSGEEIDVNELYIDVKSSGDAVFNFTVKSQGVLSSSDFNLYLGTQANPSTVHGDPFLIQEGSHGRFLLDEVAYPLTTIWTEGQQVEVRLAVNQDPTGPPTISGAGGRDADRRHVGHQRCRRSQRRHVRLPVDLQRRQHRHRHLGRDGIHIHAGGGRCGQDDQGAGELHRPTQVPGVVDQRRHRRGEHRRGEHAGDGGAHHQRRGPGGRDADRQHVGHQRCRRSQRRHVRLPVDPQRRQHRHRHPRCDVVDVHARGRGRGQVHQGEGQLHR